MKLKVKKADFVAKFYHWCSENKYPTPSAEALTEMILYHGIRMDNEFVYGFNLK